MVLDSGQLVCVLSCISLLLLPHLEPQVEFGDPTELLKNPKGKLRALVDESGDKAALYTLAGALPYVHV